MKVVIWIDVRLKNKNDKKLKKKTGFEIIRINPDKENFDMFDEIGKIQSFISNSNKRLIEQSTKKPLIDDTEKLAKIVKQLCVKQT